MLRALYGKWMSQWEYALTTRDENRVQRPLEWGFDWLADFGGGEAVAKVEGGEMSPLDAMTWLNQKIVANPRGFFDYREATDFRIEQHFPELYPTNVRAETLRQEREYKRRAEAGELRKVPFLRFTSPVKTPHPENDLVSARWYPAEHKDKRRPRQAMIVTPQWNADAFFHNALCEIFNCFGISCLRLSQPYHDTRRPPELERSDYA